MNTLFHGFTKELTPAQKRANEIDTIKWMLEADPSNTYWLNRLASLQADDTQDNYKMCPNCSADVGRHYDARFSKCLRCGAELISQADEETCCCFEIMGDNPKCPKHGGMFKAGGDDCQTCYGTGYKRISPTMLASCTHGNFVAEDYRADYQERNELYVMGMGC